jgi:hypothetical protein
MWHSAQKFPSLAVTNDIQDPKKGWRSSIAFRKFRLKHNELSKLYWTSILGSHYIGVEDSCIMAGDKLAIVGRPLSVLRLLPLRALPELLVTGSCLSWPRCSNISA